ncbi:MAG: hypothetical protein PSN36_06370 [Gammaproteobacteria bacterium]|nr:hypothetical protein [Gammaproteobacteria bacterium]
MATATIENKQPTEFAEYVFDTQKADFVKTLAGRIQKSIDIGMTQIENGESMSFDDFKAKFIKEHMLDGKI